MSPLFEYLIKLSASLAVVATFHYLFLRRLTFYNWNRVYLRVYSMLCFLVPLISIEKTVETIPVIRDYPVIKQLPQLTLPQPNVTASLPLSVETKEVDLETWLLVVLAAGTVAMFLRLLLHIAAYIRIVRKAQLVSDEDVRIYHVQQKISPFSFGNSIFYNPELHTEAELKEIILHEYIHVRQRHTGDVIWAEILCVLNWYNPFAWLIRQQVRLNLEYIADRSVLENDVDAKQYQYLLLKCAGGPDFRIANAFNIASLKQRIIMMNKKRTPRIFLISFLFALPLLAGLLLFFGPGLRETEDDPFVKFWRDDNGKLSHPQVFSTEIQTAGLILEERTGKPLANIPLEISRYGKHVKTIKTDAEGYFFATLSAKPTNEVHDRGKFVPNSYEIAYEGGEYSPFGLTEFPVYDSVFTGEFKVIFEGKGLGGTDFYSVSKKPFIRSKNKKNDEKDIKDYIQSNLAPLLAEHNLKAEFGEKVRYPKQVLTKYKDGLFDRKKMLVGYEESLKLYLDGKPATYTEINEAFESYPYMLDNSKEYRTWGQRGLCKSISYLTFDLYKSPPPAALLTNNVEWQEIKDFDLDNLKNEPYFLDGFRQTAGAGSNLMPEKKDIRKVALFKGRLAKYYDRKLERVWWVETRPESEVFERPDLALAR